MLKKFGLPRLIILIFLISTYIIAPFVGIPITTALSDTIIRFGMNAILVLSLMPMIESGAGLNFGMPLGWAYGAVLNKVKGGEMMIATYIGFSSVAFMCIMWIILPFKRPDMIWAYGGSGLRTTISVETYWKGVLNNVFGKISQAIPVGEIIFFLLLAFIMWVFFRTKAGLSMSAVGKNEKFAQATGINADKSRKQSVIISTVIAAIGIVVYQQSFGFIQLYLAPFNMAFPAIAAILIGGASVNRVTIWHVMIGTFLFQGILTMTPTVVNAVIKTDMSETIRIIVSNGMILYALTRKDGGSRG